MRAYWKAVLAVAWKDALLELRTKEIATALLVFALLAVVVFNFAIDPTPRTAATVGPGILWVAIVFSGALGLGRSFATERDGAAMTGLLLAPVARDAVYFGKVLSIFLLMAAVEVVVFPIFLALFNLSPGDLWLIPIALLATLGIAAVGTLFSAMAVNTRSREIMLPVLFLPVVLPAIVAAVEATGGVFSGESPALWVPFLVVFDAIFLVVCPAGFNLIVEE